jgi:hypothetical protein
MTRKIWNAKLLHFLLGFTFLIGLLPISNHMLSMQAMHMDATASLGSPVQEKTSNNSTGSCCEAIGSFLLACDFMAFQIAFVGSNGGNNQIAYSIPIVQSIYIESLAPPPKA